MSLLKIHNEVKEMYRIYVVFKCFPEKREAFVKKLNDEGIVSAIRAEDGCKKYDYYFSEKDSDEILLIEAWETKNHQQIHLTQSHMDKLRAIKEDYVISTKLGEFEVK